MRNFGFFLIGLPLLFFGTSEEAFHVIPYWGRAAIAFAGAYMIVYAIQNRD